MSQRFGIEQEMDDEPVYIVDNATDPDSEQHSIVTIESHYGTPSSRKALALAIVVTLEKMAASGEEIKQFDGGHRKPSAS